MNSIRKLGGKVNSAKFTPKFIEAVKNPLGFYALAIIVIYASMTIVLWTSNITEQYLFWCFIIMAVIFLTVVISVTWITIRYPKHLYESVAKDVEDLKGFIESEAFIDGVKDIIEKNYKFEKYNSNG